MAKAKLNNELIATVAGDIAVFNYKGETREYLTSSVEYLAVGVGIPANSSTDAPGESKEGFAICRTEDFTAWEYVADHRGETVYSIETGQELAITAPGDHPEGTTTPYDAWNGKKWVTDTAQQQAAAAGVGRDALAQRQSAATNKITTLDDAVSLGMATDDEREALKKWKVYRVLLSRVDISTAPDIDWPEPPWQRQG